MTGGNRLIQRCSMGFLTLSISLIAQTPSIQPLPTQDRGVVPGRTFDISGIENISIESGNLFLHIPLGSLPSGPGGSTFSVAVNYNSQVIDIGPAGPQTSTTGGGWTYGFQYSAGQELLVSVGPKTITYNDMLGKSRTVPIVSRSAAPEKNNE